MPLPCCANACTAWEMRGLTANHDGVKHGCWSDALVCMQRFGIEGCEALLPGLHTLAAQLAADGVRQVRRPAVMPSQPCFGSACFQERLFCLCPAPAYLRQDVSGAGGAGHAAQGAPERAVHPAGQAARPPVCGDGPRPQQVARGRRALPPGPVCRAELPTACETPALSDRRPHQAMRGGPHNRSRCCACGHQRRRGANPRAGMGAVRPHAACVLQDGSACSLSLLLAANPSHLEAVTPVVLGMVRGAQQRLHQGPQGPGEPPQSQAAAAIVVHGDAAFAGLGLAAESLQLSNLPGGAAPVLSAVTLPDGMLRTVWVLPT